MDIINLHHPMCEICGDQNLKSLLPRQLCPKHEGKTLIGTCGDCIYLGDEFPLPNEAPKEAIADLKGVYIYCEHEDSPCLAIPKTYGCIHWKEKER